jgi:acyl carrier protein phosphodiesterase
VSYQTVEGISRILTQMDSRTKNESKMRFSPNELIKYYTEFEQEFTSFFEDVKIESQQKLLSL